ncbi:hypothetical protein [Erythrobacter sp. Alg231-14]|uniref:hypothetical protein n=1 Tax=Erythrobacter sp. Alg231-14 TaxID=1922225 RepID=UPI00307C9967
MLELSVSLGGSRHDAQSAGQCPFANDNPDHDQKLFERSIERELVDDVTDGHSL